MNECVDTCTVASRLSQWASWKCLVLRQGEGGNQGTFPVKTEILEREAVHSPFLTFVGSELVMMADPCRLGTWGLHAVQLVITTAKITVAATTHQSSNQRTFTWDYKHGGNSLSSFFTLRSCAVGCTANQDFHDCLYPGSFISRFLKFLLLARHVWVEYVCDWNIVVLVPALVLLNVGKITLMWQVLWGGAVLKVSKRNKHRNWARRAESTVWVSRASLAGLGGSKGQCWHV